MKFHESFTPLVEKFKNAVQQAKKGNNVLRIHATPGMGTRTILQYALDYNVVEVPVYTDAEFINLEQALNGAQDTDMIVFTVDGKYSADQVIHEIVTTRKVFTDHTFTATTKIPDNVTLAIVSENDVEFTVPGMVKLQN